MLGHLVSNALQEGQTRPARSTPSLFRRLWMYLFGR
jgi:hypothetical protein